MSVTSETGFGSTREFSESSMFTALEFSNRPVTALRTAGRRKPLNVRSVFSRKFTQTSVLFNMEIEQLQCDIAHALESGDFPILQKLEAAWRDFRATIAARVKDANIYDRECTKKQSVAVKEMLRLKQEIETVKSEQDKVTLEQKIIDKKIAHLVKKHEELQVQVDDMKVERENLSLEIIDDEHVLDERKQKKQKAWNAIKLACKVYKEVLNIHIKLLNPENDCERVKVSFFTKDDRKSDKFHVCLQQQKSHWRVEQIQPTLSKEQANELKSIIDFSKQMSASDIIAFLCNLRHIFLKYYVNIK